MINQKKAGVILSYLAQGVHIITNLIYVPVMLRILGQTEYGLYQLSAAVVSNLNLLSMGFSSSYVRFYSRAKTHGDSDAVRRLDGMYLYIFSVISIICIFCGLLLSANANLVLGKNLTCSELSVSKVLMFILVLSMSINFITNVFQCQISAQENFLWLKGVELISYIINPIVTLPLLLSGYGSIGMVSVTLGISFLVCIADFIYIKKKLHITFIFTNFDWKLFKEMSEFTFYIFINILVEQINWSMDKFLLGRMQGTVSVAIYSVGFQIVSLYRSISGMIRSVFIPQINKMIVSNFSITQVTALFTKLGRMIYLVAFLICSGFIIFGKEFIYIWVGNGYENAYWVALLPMVILLIPLIQGPGIDIQRAMNQHKARSIAYLFIAIINFIISIFLIQSMGEIGASLGTSVALIIGQGLFMNYYYYKYMKIDIIYFWNTILKYLPASILCILLGYIIKSFTNCTSILGLSFSIFFYAIIYFAIFYYIGLTKKEKVIICKILFYHNK